MHPELSALIITSSMPMMASLRRHLEDLSVKVSSVQTCGEALFYLWSDSPPHVVFTDTQLPDGTWSDVLSVAKKSSSSVSVVVVSRLADTHLYVETMDRGAYDFMVSPLGLAEVEHVLRCAATHAADRRRRGVRSKAAPVDPVWPQVHKAERDGPVEDDAELAPIL